MQYVLFHACMCHGHDEMKVSCHRVRATKELRLIGMSVYSIWLNPEAKNTPLRI